MAKIEPRKAAAKSFAEKAKDMLESQSQQEPQATTVSEQSAVAAPVVQQPVEPVKPVATQYKAIVTGKVSNIERTGTHLQIPDELQRKIEQNISGSKIAVYIALLEEGYKAIMKQAEEKGGLAHLEINDILKDYRG
jgi:inner membrane protein involved in colicin E2 resistance